MDGSLHQYNAGHCPSSKIQPIAYIRRFGIVIQTCSGEMQELLFVFIFNISGGGLSLGSYYSND
jgi:hypothetical protein